MTLPSGGAAAAVRGHLQPDPTRKVDHGSPVRVAAIDSPAVLRVALARDHGRAASSDFDLNPGSGRPTSSRLRPAAVLIPVVFRPGGGKVILTRRPEFLKHHPGQVAFPGGKIETSDSGPVAAALREAREEIGLDPEAVDVIGTIPDHVTVTGFRVTPVIGIVAGPYRPGPFSGEVEEVFEVPLAHVLDPGNYRIAARDWRGERRLYYIVPYGPHYIWGATARMLRMLVACVGTEHGTGP